MGPGIFPGLVNVPCMPDLTENPDYLTKQLITCIGNKRSLLEFIGKSIDHVKGRLGRSKLNLGDFFAGSGVVSRYMKAHATRLVCNDLEQYSEVLAACYLANAREVNTVELLHALAEMKREVEEDRQGGFISELYAPGDDRNIKPGERVFYTRRNALYLDAASRAIRRRPEWMRPFLLAPLLSEASVHANTSGVFKGFYKNGEGIGCFGGRKGDALDRITGDICLQMPVWSNFSCSAEIFRQDANDLARKVKGLDLVYLDPPYNQHPYGSNYFMLNLLAEYKRPGRVSRVSGIPEGWNRSAYNVKKQAAEKLFNLVKSCDASHVLVSYNSEGFVPYGEFLSFMEGLGTLTVWDTSYNAFRGSRNLRSRPIKVKEYLYLLEKR